MKKRQPAPAPPHARALLAEVRLLRAGVRAVQRELLAAWRGNIERRGFLPSAANLAAYIGLRRQDLRDLQPRLAALGLSSLGRCEGHVLATLDAVVNALSAMCGHPTRDHVAERASAAMRRERMLLERQANQLLGPAPAQRWTRFMVTLPAQAAVDEAYLRQLLARGMDWARINCAHDDAAAWSAMVRNLRRASREADRPCRILVDLAGPKLRTGAMGPGAAVVRLKVRKGERGEALGPAMVVLDASGAAGRPALRMPSGAEEPARLAVDPGWLARLAPGDTISFADLRGKQRTLRVGAALGPRAFLAACDRSAWLAPGTVLQAAAGDCRVGPVTPGAAQVRLVRGDALLLTRDAAPGAPARVGAGGETLAPARIGCDEPAALAALRPGARVCVDDGRLTAQVEALHEDGALLRVTRAPPRGFRLKPGQSLNFPDSGLALPALTRRDLEDLDFAVAHADAVGYSFVQSGEDMDRLVHELERRGGAQLGIVAKIETRAAVRALPEIIVRGAGRHPFGVMIARGDLAVEIGWERMAEIQEEILWLAEAAHVPVIWATQVLESLVKEAVPSRAEITDAAMAERAECIMLNKGPYVLEALDTLDSVVRRMQAHQFKKAARLRALHW